jgi:hypothetical protein
MSAIYMAKEQFDCIVYYFNGLYREK